MAKKSVATLVLSIALLLAVTVGGALAYLTDTASDVNVMTLGNVQIEQTEWQRAEGVSHINEGAETGDLVPFVQGQALYPAVPKNNVSTDYSAEQNVEYLFFWGDAVIVLRGTADYATLTIKNTTLTGTPEITNTATGATVVK